MKKNSETANILKAASVYTGLIIGAGFASGQEINQYFVRFGSIGFIGMLISGLLFAACGWAVMDICVKNRFKTYIEFTNYVFGKKLAPVIDVLSVLFTFTLFCAMLSGAGAVAQEAEFLSFSSVTVITAALCFITFLFDLKGIVNMNLILTPIIVLGGIFFGIYSLLTEYRPAFFQLTAELLSMRDSFLVFALTYTSYNIITAISVLAGMPAVVTSRRIAKYSGLIGGACLTVLGLCFMLPLYANSSVVDGLSAPMLVVSEKYGMAMEAIYIMVLFSAILTTAVANGFAILERLAVFRRLPKTAIKLLVCVLGILFAHIGFSAFVSHIYPIFGYLGLFMMITVIITAVFRKKTQ